MTTTTNPAGAADDILTPVQVAELLKIHPVTARRMMQEGRLPAAKIGNAWRTRRADLDALLAPDPSER